MSVDSVADAMQVREIEVKDVLSRIEDAVNDSAEWLSQARRDFMTRHCLWEGKSEDFRKRAKALGKEPFPWEGASDTEVRLVDEICNEHAALMMRAALRSRIQTVGVEAQDTAWSSKTTALLRYMLKNRCAANVRRELKLGAQWRQWHGLAFLAVWWQQDVREMVQEVELEALAIASAAAAGVPEDAPEFGEAVQRARDVILDPLQEEAGIALLRSLGGGVSRAAARKGLNELREVGRTALDVAVPQGGMPKLQALFPMLDIVFPPSAASVEDMPWVAIRERVTETVLRERAAMYDYDSAWVEEAIKAKGTRLVVTKGSGLADLQAARDEAEGMEEDEGNLIELWRVYRKVGGVGGATAVVCDLVAAGVPERLGKEAEPLEYEHGRFPIVALEREVIGRRLMDSRGVAEIGVPMQNELKIQRDSRTDRTSLTVLPPIIVPSRRAGTRLQLGPAAQIPAQGKNEIFEWMRTPPYDPSSLEIERSTQLAADRYFGRENEGVSASTVLLLREDLIDSWLGEVREVYRQMLQLCQQYLTDAEVQRIAGALPRKWQMSAEEIRGQFDLMVEADARDLDLESMRAKWEFISGLLQADRAGRVDYSKLIEYGLQTLDASLADTVLVPAEEASMKQVNEELDALAKMMAGIEPPMQPAPGMNYQLRAQVLQQAIARNPELQRRLAGQPDSAAMVENRMKFLGFQVEQQQNAQVGRVGTKQL